ncbi:MAG: hypothetical protein RSB97_06775, partial [Christensenella sp.]
TLLRALPQAVMMSRLLRADKRPYSINIKYALKIKQARPLQGQALMTLRHPVFVGADIIRPPNLAATTATPAVRTTIRPRP